MILISSTIVFVVARFADAAMMPMNGLRMIVISQNYVLVAVHTNSRMCGGWWKHSQGQSQSKANECFLSYEYGVARFHIVHFVEVELPVNPSSMGRLLTFLSSVDEFLMAKSRLTWHLNRRRGLGRFPHSLRECAGIAAVRAHAANSLFVRLADL